MLRAIHLVWYLQSFPGWNYLVLLAGCIFVLVKYSTLHPSISPTKYHRKVGAKPTMPSIPSAIPTSSVEAFIMVRGVEANTKAAVSVVGLQLNAVWTAEKTAKVG
jgi:hypothetical protein